MELDAARAEWPWPRLQMLPKQTMATAMATAKAFKNRVHLSNNLSLNIYIKIYSLSLSLSPPPHFFKSPYSPPTALLTAPLEHWGAEPNPLPLEGAFPAPRKLYSYVAPSSGARALPSPNQAPPRHFD